jgi:hypothetical protein
MLGNMQPTTGQNTGVSSAVDIIEPVRETPAPDNTFPRNKTLYCKVKISKNSTMTQDQLKMIVETVQSCFMRVNMNHRGQLMSESSNKDLNHNGEFRVTSAESRKHRSLKGEMKQTKLALRKHEYRPMEVLDIQNILARDYHYSKWQLIELMEIEEREIKSLALQTNFKELICTIYEQVLNKGIKVNISKSEMSYTEII